MKRPGLAVLIAISAVNPVALNILQPAIPGLAETFGTNYGTAQLTLTGYLFAFAVAQLVHGPASDRYGRRPVVFAGFILFLIGTLGCALATSIETLIAARIVQAAGGCAGFILARAIVRDMYDREKAASQLGYLTTVMVLAPMCAPALGGALDASVGWLGIFIFLAIFGGAVLAIAILFLHETRSPAVAGSGSSLFRSFPILMRNRLFLAHAGTMSFTYVAFFSFLGGAPYIVVTLLGEPPYVYGLYFMLSSTGYMIGNFIAARTAVRVGARALIRHGTLLAVASAVLLAASQWLWPTSALALFLPMVPLSMSMGLTLPSATASAVSVRPDIAGAAAGLSGALQLGLSALGSGFIAHVLTDSAWPLVYLILTTTVIAYLVARLADRFADHDPHAPARTKVASTVVPQ